MTYAEALRKVGSFGKYQKILCLLLTLSSIPNGYLVLSVVFTGLKPQHRCKIPDIDREQNSSIEYDTNSTLQHYIPLNSDGKLNGCHQFISFNQTNVTVSCQHGWVYDMDEGRNSFVTEWNLVCENDAVRPVITMVFMIGVMVGSVVSGILSDHLGRRPVFLIGTYSMFLCFILCSFANSPAMFTAMFFFAGMTNFINFAVAFVLASETIDTTNRVVTGTLTIGGFALGYMIIPLIAYMISNWRTIYLVCGLTGLAFIPYYWLILESPSWLYSRGRFVQFRIVMKKIAKANGTLNSELENYLENIKESKDSEQHENKTVEKFWKVFATKSVLFRLLNMCFTWFIASLTYYSLSFNTSNLGGNPYWNCFVAAAVEIPAYTFVIVSLKFFGRKAITIFTMFLSGGFCLSIPFLSAVDVTSSIVVGMIGKFFVSACFAIIYIYCAELFPTSIRTTTMGLASMCARIGAAISPFIIYLGEQTWYLSYLIIFMLSLFSCLITMFLPETNKRPIPETINDIGSYSLFSDLCGKNVKNSEKKEIIVVDEEVQVQLMSKI